MPTHERVETIVNVRGHDGVVRARTRRADQPATGDFATNLIGLEELINADTQTRQNRRRMDLLVETIHAFLPLATSHTTRPVARVHDPRDPGAGRKTFSDARINFALPPWMRDDFHDQVWRDPPQFLGPEFRQAMRRYERDVGCADGQRIVTQQERRRRA